MKPIPILLFAGFLGAGKTTLLGRMLPELARGRKIALLINDFGRLSIDGALLKRHGVPTFEIAGGSIFCVCKQATLINQLTEIAATLEPDLLLIEASGLAEPTDTQALLQNTFLREVYGKPQVISVVDAVNYPKLAHTLPVIDQQIGIADLLIVTKIDRADPGELLARLRQLNPAAPILQADERKLYGTIALQTPECCAQNASLRLCATATAGFSVINWRGDATEEQLTAWLTAHQSRLLRAKGVYHGRRLDLVNGEIRWFDDAPPGENELFFALQGEQNREAIDELENFAR